MTNEEMARMLDEAVELIEQVRTNLVDDTPPPEPETEGVKTVAEFDAAMAAGEEEIYCDVSLVYDKPLKLVRSVNIVHQLGHAEQVSETDALPLFTKGIVIEADNCTLKGLRVRDSALDDIVYCKTGIFNTLISQCHIQGDATSGNKRGIYMNSSGLVARCWIDGIKRVGQDTQAILVTAMAGEGLTIDDCFLAGAAQSFMAGGEDHSEALKPRGILISNCTLTKTTDMYSASPNWQRKCALELKNIRGFKMENCDLSGAGISQGQGGYLMVFTPRNQNGRDASSCVEDVEIVNCTGDMASGIATFLGTDTEHPSGPLRNLVIENFTATNLDPKGPTGGNARVFLFQRGPQEVYIKNISVTGKNLKAIAYFDGNQPPTRTSLISWRYPGGTPYTWHNPNGDSLASLQKYAPDMVLEDLEAHA